MKKAITAIIITAMLMITAAPSAMAADGTAAEADASAQSTQIQTDKTQSEQVQTDQTQSDQTQTEQTQNTQAQTDQTQNAQTQADQAKAAAESCVPEKSKVKSVRKEAFDTVKISAASCSRADGYQFAYSTSSASGYDTISTGAARTVSKSLLKPGKKYYYKVRAYNNANGKRYYSTWSSAKSKKLPVKYGAERWRYTVKKTLKERHVYSKWRENAIMHIIKRESGGHAAARGGGGEYVGLVQFGSHWKHNYSRAYFQKHSLGTYRKDNRKSGTWSIYTMVNVIRKSGNSGIMQHWGL